jgi:hypothetical protein
LGYMAKILNQIIFFSSTKIRIFFQQHWESEYLKKNPKKTKLNGRSLTKILLKIALNTINQTKPNRVM